ncbi:MAG: dockerin type I domain-containing protein [Patescibacteria group bacterium]
MKKELLKIATIFLITIGVVLWGLNFIFFKGNAPKSKAAGETMNLSFTPATATVAANADFTVTILAKPSINTVLRGYKTKVNFDKAILKLKSIQYKIGVVSAGLGNTTADVTAVNGNGFVDVIGEDTTATGYTLGAANGAEIVSLTFTALAATGTTVTMTDSSFYSVNSDGSLFDTWTIAAQNLDVNGGEAKCQSFSDDFSASSLNESNWRFISWTNGYETVGTAGTLNIHLPLSTEVTAKSSFVESKKILIGNFSSEITLVSRNDPSTYEFFQFNNKAYGEAVTGGFGFRILNGSLYTEVYGTDNPNNPGPSNHNILVSNTTPIKLKLEKIGTSAKMSIDTMNGQGYQVIRVFENFNTNAGYVIAGVQHTGPTNLTLDASFDNYNQTCSTTGAGNVKLNLKLKFQGISKLPATGQNSMVVKIKLINQTNNQAIDFQTVPFTADDKGIWSGQAGFNSNNIFTVTDKYLVLVKGPQHIQKKICDGAPTETAGPGLYGCANGSITLAAGDNNLDFSGILLLAGDLDQNGIVDSIDFGLVRNNLGKTDVATLAKADINRDGIVNTQDFSMILVALGIRTDER